MFWSGNYIAVRELNCLLKEENVSLTQVLEADDILQECKADNKVLIQFLTKPDVLAELITLITEEPPKDVELASQYRHASIACEVLTSHLSMLSDRLSLDSVQMNRLCDFINKEPPLNPLLASYFSKTVEMLLERSPKQDWYLYHIVCLRVLDFFKSRRDFLPNLLRHLATSAIADTIKCFIRLDDLFNKIVMEWLEEHQFLESLIQIICGTYVPEPLRPAGPVPAPEPEPAELLEKAHHEQSEKYELNHKEDGGRKGDEGKEAGSGNKSSSGAPAEQTAAAEAGAETATEADAEEAAVRRRAAERSRAVAAANAADLLADLILNGCAPEGCTTRLRTVWVLVSRLQSEEWVRALLGGMFTSPAAARDAALVHGARVLLALLSADPILAGVCAGERTSVELAVAPHLPLLHQALLRPPDTHAHTAHTAHTAHAHLNHHEGGNTGQSGRPAQVGQSEQVGQPERVGWARTQVAALLAQLALSEVEDVPTTMLTLGTPGTLVELMFRHPDNNFLHAHVYALIKHALANRAYRTQYAHHLFVECDLLTRLMDVFEENENRGGGRARAGYMGHVVLALRRAWLALDEADGELAHALRLPAPLLQRFRSFVDTRLEPLLHHHDTPLGGYYPSENIYEVENMDTMGDSMQASYEFNDVVGGDLDELGADIDINSVSEVYVEAESGESREADDGQEKMSNARNIFLQLAGSRFDDDMWQQFAGSGAEEFENNLHGSGISDEVQDLVGGSGGGAPQDPLLTTFTAWDSTNLGESSTAGGADTLPTSEETEGPETGGGWAHFEQAAAVPPVDPFAPLHGDISKQFTAYWFSGDDTSPDASTTLDLEDSMRNLKISSEEDSVPERPPSPPAPFATNAQCHPAPTSTTPEILTSEQKASQPAITGESNVAANVNVAPDVPKSDNQTIDATKTDSSKTDVTKTDKSTTDVTKTDESTTDVTKTDESTTDVTIADNSTTEAEESVKETVVNASAEVAPSVEVSTADNSGVIANTTQQSI